MQRDILEMQHEHVDICAKYQRGSQTVMISHLGWQGSFIVSNLLCKNGDKLYMHFLLCNIALRVSLCYFYTSFRYHSHHLKQRTVETLLTYDKPISIKFDEADISLKSKIDLISVSIQMQNQILYKEIQ